MLETLKRRIMEGDHDDLFSELIFERTPHVFGGDVEACRTWTGRLAKMLNVDSSEIKLVGGAAIGFSLNPHKNFAAFTPDSDIDVAIVSDHYFSEAWHYLRSLDVTLAKITHAQRSAIGEHRKRYIYWGTIAADRILSILPFAQVWMAARESMASTVPTEGRDINFRIYKDFRALRAYQRQGLTQLRTMLMDGGE